MRTVSETPACSRSGRFPPVPRLKRRPDFLRAASGDRFHVRAFSLQATPLSESASAPGDEPRGGRPARFGITVTKRIGGAVARNRIKRRLKEALRLTPDLPARPGRDYVIVAKVEALTADFRRLQDELSNAIRKIDRPSRPKQSKSRPGRR